MTSIDIASRLREKARTLLETKQVACVIGYERASDGLGARPCFAYSPDEADRLIFDNTCVHNLAKYLLNKKGQKVAVVVKPCDSRSVNQLVLESQVKRDQVVVIGVPCSGVVDWRWGEGSDRIEQRCRGCTLRAPVVYDVLAGDGISGVAAPDGDRYSALKAMEARTSAERSAFWQAEFDACVRCYACRQVCPGCYCVECFVDQLNPMWVGPRIAPAQNQLWHIIRAMHQAGRCSGCNECERVCPVGIPLGLLNQKLEKVVEEKYSYRAGMQAEGTLLFGAFRPRLQADSKP